MWPVILVSLGAAALAFYLDSQTDSEERYHVELRRSNEDLRSRITRAMQEQAAPRDITRMARQMSGECAVAMESYLARLNSVDGEFAALRARLREDLADVSISPFRRNSLQLLQARLDDACNRLVAYRLYGSWYLERQKQLLDSGRYADLLDLGVPGSRLPEDWFYDGKLGLIEVPEIGERNRYGQVLQLLQDKHGERYSDAVQRALLLQHPDQDAIPVQLLASKNPRYFKACLLRGALYVEHILPRRPCLGIVTRSIGSGARGEGYEVRCFPSLFTVNGQLVLTGGVRAFLPLSESAFPGKRYHAGERLEVLLHHHGLLLQGAVTLTQQPESLDLGSSSTAPVFVVANAALHDLAPLLREAERSSWQLRGCQEVGSELVVSLQLGPWRVDATFATDEGVLRVQALSPVGIDTVMLDTLPFALRFIDDRFSGRVYVDALRFGEFRQFCRQQALFGGDQEVRRAAGEFFERWSRVNDYLRDRKGYETFALVPRAEPEDRSWDCACQAGLVRRLKKEDEEAGKKQRSMPRLYIEELHTGAAGERWLRIGELKGMPEELGSGVVRLPHGGIQRTAPERGLRPMEPPRLRLRIPDGRELANLERQSVALQAFMAGRLVNPTLQQILLTPGRYEPVPDPTWARRVQAGLSWHNSAWQASQAAQSAKRIVEAALVESNLYLVQGPPGTGKTTCIVEMLYQIYAANPETRVLVVSQQNTAVDNALARFLQSHPAQAANILRIGNDAEKIQTELKPRMADAVLSDYFIGRQQAYSRAAALGEDQKAAWIQLWMERIHQPREGRSPYDEELAELLVEGHPLVGATCVGLASRRHGCDRMEFDLCIIDEGGRSTVPEMLIPLLRCRKAIIIGDHFQLPPSVAGELMEAESREILPFLEDAFLKTSFFERLYEDLAEGCRGRLTEQFRMVEPIGDLVSDLFYTTAGKRGLFNGKRHDRRGFLDPDHPLRWHDVPQGREELENGKGPSRQNVGEARAIRDFVAVAASALRTREENASRRKTVAVITPYGAQKRLIRRLLEESANVSDVLDIEVDTVDSFQGSEADIVLYSTVRTAGSIHFLLDWRRLNVACSRARENLVFFGCSEFLLKRETRSERPLFTLIHERATRTAVPQASKPERREWAGTQRNFSRGAKRS
ncbi:DEAD/DEAH box helicase [Delftia sp. JD2]|uniref:DEAD/DEAH box helicase n=1 Tax=Delftia sp. JD2 TaxID=469553 RepID=UPI000806AB29|nr:AAA domain-containing protein [Delftia sp. JD2]